MMLTNIFSFSNVFKKPFPHGPKTCPKTFSLCGKGVPKKTEKHQMTGKRQTKKMTGKRRKTPKNNGKGLTIMPENAKIFAFT